VYEKEDTAYTKSLLILEEKEPNVEKEDQMNNTSTVLTNILQPDEILHKNSQYNTGDLEKENGSLPLVTNDHNKEDCMQVDEVNK
jgi:hypothetical protein